MRRSLLSTCAKPGIVAATMLVCLSPTLADGDRVKRGLEFLAQGDTLAAIEELRHADLDGIGDPVLFMILGRLYREQGTIESRLKSNEVLQRANRLFPRHSGILNELGLTYFSRTFYGSAVRAFKEVHDLNPSICESKYKIAVSSYEHWKSRVSEYLDDAMDARAWLKSALECDSTNLDGARRYVYVQYGLKMKEEAVESARAFARLFPDAPDFPLIVGTVAFDGERYTEADSSYRHALMLMSDEERGAYLTLGRNVLSYDDMDVYDDTNDDGREVIDRGYWVNADWDPTTDLNERHLEHVYRVFRADLFFSAAKPHIVYTRPQRRGWDTERGELSIKFGWPHTIQGAYGGYRWEKWNYTRGEEFHQFVFTDSWMNNRYQIGKGYEEKLVFLRHSDRVTATIPEWADVSGAMDVATFRDGDLEASTYVLFDVLADSIEARVDIDSTDFHLRARFFRTDWTVEATFADTLRGQDLAVVPGSVHTLFDYARRYPVTFDRYQLACAFDDDQGRVNAQFRADIDARRFAGDHLQLSDIVFERGGAAGAAFVRAGHMIRPNPWRTFSNDQKLRAYFEVYNLAARGGQSHFDLTYEIRPEKDRDPSGWNRLGEILADFLDFTAEPAVIAQTFDRVGEGHTSGETIAIEIGALEEGWYRLVVTVADGITGEQVDIGKRFFKAGEPIAAASK